MDNRLVFCCFALASTLLRLDTRAIILSCWYDESEERLVAEIIDIRFLSRVLRLLSITLDLPYDDLLANVDTLNRLVAADRREILFALVRLITRGLHDKKLFSTITLLNKKLSLPCAGSI